MHGCPDPDCGREFETHRGMKVHHSNRHDENGGRVEKTCPVCDSVFEVVKSRADIETRCSDECRRNSGNYGNVTRTCPVCGDDVTVPKNRAERTDYSFCDQSCHGKWRSSEYSGPGHPSWEGGSGLYSFLANFYGDGSWKDISRSVRERSDGCELCGSDGELNTHHIIPLRCGGTHADWNLMAVCVGCHAKTEAFSAELFDSFV